MRMTKTWLRLLVIAFSVFAGVLTQAKPDDTEKCSCTSWPYRPKPPCEQVCPAQALQKLSATELVAVLGLTEDAAAAVVQARSSAVQRQLLSDYSNVLSGSQYALLKRRFEEFDSASFGSLQLALGGGGGGGGGSGGDTIKVGVLHSLSGTMAISETALKDTVLMQIDEINAKGGLLGKKVQAVVVDPASNWPLFAEKARQLIQQDKVAVIFGGWTSVSRKAMLPIIEDQNSLLFYPAPFEGEELSSNVFYTGAAPNQLALPAVEYLLSKEGGNAKQFVLVGTDYVYPRTINKIVRAFLKSKGVADSDIAEEYIRFGESDFGKIIANAKRLSLQGRKTAIISTINGDSNISFYRELNRQGLRNNDLPVLSLTLGEEELRGVDAKPLQGYLSASNYFMSLKNPANDDFLRRWSAYARSKGIATQKDKPFVTDSMEATYIGVQMWADAVRKAKSTATDKVIAAMAGQTLNAPSGTTVMMDLRNHYLHKSFFIGEVKSDGQINVIWKAPGPIRAQPWSPYIPENKGKRDEPERK